MLDQKNSRGKKKPEIEATKIRTKRISKSTGTQNKQKQLAYRGKEKIVF